MVLHDIKANTTELSQKMYVQNGAGRFVDPEGRSSIIKGDTMYVIDESEKSYMVLDKATMEQLGKQLSAEMEQLKEQLAKMPPEQRAQMEQMMGIQSDGDGGQMGSRSRRHRQVRQGGRTRLQGLGREAQRQARRSALRGPLFVLARQGRFPGGVPRTSRRCSRRWARTIPTLAGMMSSEFSALAKVNGFPVRTRNYENGRLADDEQLVKVWREETIPAAMFEVPAGYTQKKMPMPGAN